MNQKQILVVAGVLSIIAGFILFTPLGVMFVLVMSVLISGMFSSFSPDISFALMVIVFFVIAMGVIYLMFRNLRIVDPQ